MITSWSHSKLVDFEKCKFLAYLKHDQKIPEPERPLPPGKTEHANDRGTRVHNALEAYVRGDSGATLPSEAAKFSTEVNIMRDLYAVGRVSLEGEWGMNMDWEPTDYKTAWLRLKLDSIVFLSDNEAIVVDYKTGKKFGNEIKHGDQMLIYQLSAFMRYPKLEIVHAELWYLDADELTQKTYTREQGLRFKPALHRRGLAITTCQDFPPRPSVATCQYCQYGPWNGGQCKSGVRR